jgi:hypothetical protein
VAPVASEFDVSDLIEEQTSRVSYFTALKTLAAADAIIIPGSDDPAYTPSKLANCWLARRPTLALAAANSEFAGTAGQLGFTIAPRPSDDRVITGFLNSLQGRPAASDSGLAFFNNTFSARTATERECALFEDALSHHS